MKAAAMATLQTAATVAAMVIVATVAMDMVKERAE
jgi:hypothetical protein